MAFACASIPAGLLSGSGEDTSKEQGVSLGPFKWPVQFPLKRDGGSSGARTSADVASAARQLKQLVSGSAHPSTGRGGVASTSGPSQALFPAAVAGRRTPSIGMKLEYLDDTPRLLGTRSISLRPRHLLPLSGAEPVYDDRDSRWWAFKDSAMHGSYSWALQDYDSDREEAPVPGDSWRAEVPSEVELEPVLTCRDLVKQVLVDQRGRPDAVQCAFPDQPCPAGSYKVMAFYSPVPADDPAANYCDHHFYMQHKDVNVTLEPGDRLRDVARFFKLPVEDLYEANPGLAAVPEDAPLDRPRSLRVPGANVWSHKPSPYLPPRLHDGAGRAIHNPLRAVAAYSDDEGGMNDLPAQYCCSFCVRQGEAKTGVQSRVGEAEE